MIAIHRPFDLCSGMSVSALYWKPLSRPTDHATGHAAHVRETSLLQELYGGDAAVSAPADDDDFFRRIELFHSRGEASQRNMNCTRDIPLSQFVWLTHINDHCSSLLLHPRLLMTCGKIYARKSQEILMKEIAWWYHQVLTKPGKNIPRSTQFVA
jgi:hypothetical protein